MLVYRAVMVLVGVLVMVVLVVVVSLVVVVLWVWPLLVLCLFLILSLARLSSRIWLLHRGHRLGIRKSQSMLNFWHSSGRSMCMHIQEACNMTYWWDLIVLFDRQVRMVILVMMLRLSYLSFASVLVVWLHG